MQRPRVVIGGILLLVAAIAAGVYFGDTGTGPERAIDGIDEALRHDGEDRDGESGGRAQPVLQAGPAGRNGAARNAREGEGPEAAGDGVPAGPGEILVLSSETDAPLTEVSIRDAEGEVVGVTGEDGVLALERIPGEGLEFRALLSGYLPTVGKSNPGERVEVLLRPGVSVSGHVVRAGHRGEPGAAAMNVWDEDLGVEIASFTTDETGAFEIPAVRPNRPFVLTVRLEGLVPHVQRIVLDAPTDDLEVLVGEGGFLTGRVQTPTGAPLTNVEVRLLRAGEVLLEHRLRAEDETRGRTAQIAARIATTRTDEEGRYSFQGIALEQAVQPVAVLKPRYIARGKTADFAEVGETLERDIAVRAPAALRIRVEETGGKAIGDADVTLRGVNGAWTLLPGDERVEGSLVLEDLSAGALTVTARKPGAPDRSAQVTLEAGATAAVTLTFPRGMALTGTVKDKRGKPIWKAKVHWLAEGGERVEVRTEMDGSFHFTRLEQPKGTVHVTARDMTASVFGYESETVEDVAAAGPPLRLVLKDGTRVTGSFPDLPRDARVHSSMYPGTKRDEWALKLDPDLRFVRRGPPPKTSPLFVFRTRGFPPLLRGERLPFLSEEARDLGPLFFQARNPRQGRVLGADGGPVWAAKVTLSIVWASGDVRTDRQGDFEFLRLPRRPVPILVEAEDYPAAETTLEIGSEFKRQIIRLRKIVRVDVRLGTPRKRHPARRAITLHPLFDPPDGAGRKTIKGMTGRNGILTIDVSPGRYRLEAELGQGEKKSRTISVTLLDRQSFWIPAP